MQAQTWGRDGAENIPEDRVVWTSWYDAQSSLGISDAEYVDIRTKAVGDGSESIFLRDD